MSDAPAADLDVRGVLFVFSTDAQLQHVHLRILDDTKHIFGFETWPRW